jgi:3-dehydroshikimate dehydratase
LAVSSYGSYYKAGHDLAGFDAILETARALGAPRIRVWAGTVGADEADPDARRAVTHDLRRVVELARRADVRVAAEFHGGTLTSHAASAARLLREVPGLESYWQPRADIGPDEALSDLASLADHLVHAHVFHWQPGGQRHALSAGRSCWPLYLRALRDLPRSLHVQLEYVKDDRPGQLREDAATLRGWLDDAFRA